MEINTLIIITAVSLAVICFMNGIVSAYFSASRLAIELKKKQNKYSGRVWYDYFQNPPKFISATLALINLLLVIFVYTGWLLLITVYDYWGIQNIYIQMIIAAAIGTMALLIVDLFFRITFHSLPNSILGSGFVTFLVKLLLSPVAWIAVNLVQASEWILKFILNVKINKNTVAFSRPDIDMFVQQLKNDDQDDKLEKNNEIFENIISLSEKKIKACLIPRKEIIAVNINASIDELIQKFNETKLSKLIIYRDSIDTIEGYVHQLDMFRKPATIKEILLPIPIVPESMNATDLINKFTRERKSIAWVIDEFGGTAGVVTMEDLLEEIFGDIFDEFDGTKAQADKQISPKEYILSGRLSLDIISEKYQLQFKRRGEAETLSGYIINRSGTIPRQKERVIIDDYLFDILSVSSTRIETVRLKILQ